MAVRKVWPDGHQSLAAEVLTQHAGQLVEGLCFVEAIAEQGVQGKRCVEADQYVPAMQQYGHQTAQIARLLPGLGKQCFQDRLLFAWVAPPKDDDRDNLYVKSCVRQCFVHDSSHQR